MWLMYSWGEGKRTPYLRDFLSWNNLGTGLRTSLRILACCVKSDCTNGSTDSKAHTVNRRVSQGTSALLHRATLLSVMKLRSYRKLQVNQPFLLHDSCLSFPVLTYFLVVLLNSIDSSICFIIIITVIIIQR